MEGLPFLEQSLKSQNYTIAEIMPKGFPPIKVAFSPEVKEISLKKPRKREDFQHHIEVHVAALCFKEENTQLYILAGKRKKTRALYPTVLTLPHTALQPLPLFFYHSQPFQ